MQRYVNKQRGGVAAVVYADNKIQQVPFGWLGFQGKDSA